jgi:hypothetical protein
MEKSLTVEKQDGVATVSMVGPGKGNAMGPDFWSELVPLFGALDVDGEAVGAVHRAARVPAAREAEVGAGVGERLELGGGEHHGEDLTLRLEGTEPTSRGKARDPLGSDPSPPVLRVPWLC